MCRENLSIEFGMRADSFDAVDSWRNLLFVQVRCLQNSLMMAVLSIIDFRCVGELLMGMPGHVFLNIHFNGRGGLLICN